MMKEYKDSYGIQKAEIRQTSQACGRFPSLLLTD